jgi:AcrR family transcriptional regulator
MVAEPSATEVGGDGNVRSVRGQGSESKLAGPVARLSHELRREQLLDAASTLIVERSLGAVTMEGVAAQAGVSKALPYRFFANRDDLLMSLYDREAGLLTARVRAATRGVEGYEQRVRAVVQAWLEGVTERGLVLGVLVLSSPRGGPIEDRRQRLVTDLARDWARELSREFGVDERRAQRMITFVLVGSQALIPFWLHQVDERATLIDDFVRFVVGGSRALMPGAGQDTVVS